MGILLFVLVFVPFSFSPNFSSKISPQPFEIETSNLVYRFTTTSYNVENGHSPICSSLYFSFSLHFSSKIPAICFGSAIAGVKSDFLTVLVSSVHEGKCSKNRAYSTGRCVCFSVIFPYKKCFVPRIVRHAYPVPGITLSSKGYVIMKSKQDLVGWLFWV